MDIEYMNYVIDNFIYQYYGTAIGESIKKRRLNTRDNDLEGIEEIYNDLVEQGYV